MENYNFLDNIDEFKKMAEEMGFSIEIGCDDPGLVLSDGSRIDFNSVIDDLLNDDINFDEYKLSETQYFLKFDLNKETKVSKLVNTAELTIYNYKNDPSEFLYDELYGDLLKVS